MSPVDQDISVSVKAVVVDGDNILVIKYTGSYLHYNFPGGRVRNGDALRETVVRKVREETLCEAVVERLLLVVEYIPERWAFEFGSQQKVQFNFLCRLAPGSPAANMPDEPDEKQIDVGWVQVRDLPSLRLLPRVASKVLAALQVDGTVDPLVDEW